MEEDPINIALRLKSSQGKILLEYTNVELSHEKITYEELCNKIIQREIPTDWKACSTFRILHGYASSSRNELEPVKGFPSTNILVQVTKFNFIYFTFVIEHDPTCACLVEPEPSVRPKNAFDVLMRSSR